MLLIDTAPLRVGCPLVSSMLSSSGARTCDFWSRRLRLLLWPKDLVADRPFEVSLVGMEPMLFLMTRLSQGGVKWEITGLRWGRQPVMMYTLVSMMDQPTRSTDAQVRSPKAAVPKKTVARTMAATIPLWKRKKKNQQSATRMISLQETHCQQKLTNLQPGKRQPEPASCRWGASIAR